MLKNIIEKLIAKEDLTEQEMQATINTIMQGKVDDAQIGAFLAALRMKGETLEEIVGAAKAMRENARSIPVNGRYMIDTCGTGGDGAQTFNVSTVVALVAASAGIKVVKHGNRSVSSKCGSADVLEQLGVNIHMDPEAIAASVESLNIGIAFAPDFHQAMKHVAPARKALGLRTIFNILGPLSNPAKVQGQVLGVFDESLTEILAMALSRLGAKHVMVVHGMDGLDEITITQKTKVSELRNGTIRTYYIDPRDYGLPLGKSEALIGESSAHNAEIIKDVLKGAPGAKRNLVLLNAGAAIYVGGKAQSLGEGIEKAKDLIDRGDALQKLNQLVQLSQELTA